MSEPYPVTLDKGISYPVEMRATPGYTSAGLPRKGAVMWSADLNVFEGVSLTARGSTPAKALAALRRVIDAHAPTGD